MKVHCRHITGGRPATAQSTLESKLQFMEISVLFGLNAVYALLGMGGVPVLTDIWPGSGWTGGTTDDTTTTDTTAA